MKNLVKTPEDQPFRRRSDRILIAVLALIGVVLGLYMSLMIDPDVIFSNVSPPNTPGGNATLEVVFFERFRYTRTSPETAVFRMEVAFWTWAPPILPVIGGVVGGGLVGYLTGRWLKRAPWKVGRDV